MRPEERDPGSLWDMREAAREIAAFVEGVTRDQYTEAPQVRRAVERDLEIIGEAARHVSEAFRLQHPEIPWRQIIGLRNILSHDYGSVDDERVFAVAQGRIPELITQLNRLL